MSKDRPFFEARLLSVCSSCKLDYQNSGGDSATQMAQAESALASGGNMLVLDPVDGTSAAAIIARAKAKHVPVISYDSLVLNSAAVDYYVSFDNSTVGAFQASGLLKALQLPGKTNPSAVMINGDAKDGIARSLKQGVRIVLAGKVRITVDYDTPSWSPDKAQAEMANALVQLHGAIDGVYAADDGTAAGAIAAMKAAGAKPPPPVTGDGATLASIQSIIAGVQYMTVYRSIKTEAEAAAQLAYDLAYGIPIPSSMSGGKTVNNGGGDIPAVLLSPVAVTRETVVSAVVADRYWSRADICTAQSAAACSAAGIT